ncbi:hypothetical protein JHN59_40235 [Streptomyces sp. MBT49]|uniref:hypothetical protein n=1 Tax=unclassified Streptomyces TaxID=2593676 RepID=UPI00190DDD9A|nr:MULTISPECIES: hypothetical protein [unclassified Streptomyces]MBK3630914.1 hypothetical protein [Streptomyces sp. MBT49]MBK3637186.1 hypothetical protein [Streptomyces sp. MBT97]
MYTRTAALVLHAGTALALALLLVSCSGGPSDEDRKYADAVAAADPEDFGAIATDDLADTLQGEASELCEKLGESYEAAATHAALGFSRRESAALISAAVLVRCPEHEGKLPV